MKNTLHTLLIPWIAVALSHSAWSCPFCPPSFNNSIVQELDATSVAVLAELVTSPQTDEDGQTVTGYRVVEVLRGGDRLKSGDAIDLPLKIPSPRGSIHLLLAIPDEHDQWQQPRGLSIAAREFLGEAAKLPAVQGSEDKDAQLRRLAFALDYLDSDDAEVRRAVNAEFAAASYATVKQLAPLLNPHELKARIALETDDRRLLFTLLAICGRKVDAEFVKNGLDDCVSRDKVAELDGMIAAYLTLAGSAGLDQIDEELLEPNEVAPGVRRAAESALRFHAEKENVISKQRIIVSTRLLLDDPRSADYAVRDLTRWEDWQSLGMILELLDEVSEHRWLKQPIQEYLEACPIPEARAAMVATASANP